MGGSECKGGLRLCTFLGEYRRYIAEGPLCALDILCSWESPTLRSPTGLSLPHSSEPGSITIYQSYDISDVWVTRSLEKNSSKKGAQRTSHCRAGPEFVPCVEIQLAEPCRGRGRGDVRSRYIRPHTAKHTPHTRSGV